MAVVTVLLFHTAVLRIFQQPWLPGGHAGVDLFFVLSGFLIGGLLFRELHDRGWLHVGRFIVRRGFKIWPSYAVYLAFVAVWIWNDGMSVGAVLRKLAAQVSAEAPAAGTAAVAEHRGGLFTMSPDGRFVAGPVPDLPGLWVASGCNGSGFSSSPALGEALATWIATGTPPQGAEALSPASFGPLPDDALITRGLWQYAHYYDPASAAGRPAPGHSRGPGGVPLAA